MKGDMKNRYCRGGEKAVLCGWNLKAIFLQPVEKRYTGVIEVLQFLSILPA